MLRRAANATVTAMRSEADVHVRWLLDAIAAGAKRHDPFEIERHFAVESAQAVDLGRELHGIATDGRALVAVSRVARSRDGGVIVEYRSVDGSDRCLVAARHADGRLGVPTFQLEEDTAGEMT